MDDKGQRISEERRTNRVYATGETTEERTNDPPRIKITKANEERETERGSVVGAARNLLLIVRSVLERRSYTTTIVFYTVSFQLRAFLNTKYITFFLLLPSPLLRTNRDVETNF